MTLCSVSLYNECTFVVNILPGMVSEIWPIHHKRQRNASGKIQICKKVPTSRTLISAINLPLSEVTSVRAERIALLAGALGDKIQASLIGYGLKQ